MGLRTFNLYTNMYAELNMLCKRIDQFEPKFRDGSAKATWLEDGVIVGFNKARVMLTLWWLISDSTHTLAYTDFHLSQAALQNMNWLGTADLNSLSAQFTERSRTKLISYFRAEMGDANLNVGQKFLSISNAMHAAYQETLNLIDTTGSASTIKYEDNDGVKVKVGKTLAEMGISGVALADLLVTLKAEIRGLITGD